MVIQQDLNFNPVMKWVKKYYGHFRQENTKQKVKLLNLSHKRHLLLKGVIKCHPEMIKVATHILCSNLCLCMGRESLIRFNL